MSKSLEIRIVLNGYTVRAGCQTLVYAEKSALLRDLEAYLDDPQGVSKRILASACNRKITFDDAPPNEPTRLSRNYEPEGQMGVGASISPYRE